MAKANKPYNAEHELAGMVLMVEQLLAMQDKLDMLGGNAPGLKHNINMQRRDLKIACAQYHQLNKSQAYKHKPQYSSQQLNWGR